MALTKCAECGNDISDKAPSCPSCGIVRKSALAVPITNSPGTIIVAVLIIVFAIYYLFGVILVGGR